jgi:hypothetical protein
MLASVILGFTPLVHALQTEKTEPMNKHFVYNVFYGTTKIGKIIRDERRVDERYHVSLSADLSFLFLNLGGYQNSTIVWQKDIQWYKPINFERRTTGFDSKNVTAEFSDDAHHATVSFEGEKSTYNEPSGLISELNAMFLQVRHGLNKGQKMFDFYMQTSDSIDHHFFEVKAEETIDTKFGKLKTFRLDQIKVKNRALSVWYAPELDMQMVKFHYQRKIVDINGELYSYDLK